MGLIDKVLKANEQYARTYDAKLGGHPQPRVAIVTCMDPRLSDLEGILGLKTEYMDVIRTGGPAVTDDVLGALVVSTRVLGSHAVLLIQRSRTAHEGANCQSQIASVDREGRSGARLHLRRAQWSFAGSDRRRSGECLFLGPLAPVALGCFSERIGVQAEAR